MKRWKNEENKKLIVRNFVLDEDTDKMLIELIRKKGFQSRSEYLRQLIRKENKK